MENARDPLPFAVRIQFICAAPAFAPLPFAVKKIPDAVLSVVEVFSISNPFAIKLELLYVVLLVYVNTKG